MCFVSSHVLVCKGYVFHEQSCVSVLGVYLFFEQSCISVLGVYVS